MKLKNFLFLFLFSSFGQLAIAAETAAEAAAPFDASEASEVSKKVELREAIFKGDIDSVKALIAEDESLLQCQFLLSGSYCSDFPRMACGGRPWGLMEYALDRKEVAIASFLHEMGAEYDFTSKAAVHLLFFAVYENNVEFVRFLLLAGTPVNSKDSVDWTPLHKAAFEGYAEMVKVLLEARADSSLQNDPERGQFDVDLSTPLHLAAGNFHLDVVKLLVVGDVRSVILENKNGQSPRQYMERRYESLTGVRVLRGRSTSSEAITTSGKPTLRLEDCLHKPEVLGIKPGDKNWGGIYAFDNKVKIIKLLKQAERSAVAKKEAEEAGE